MLILLLTACANQGFQTLWVQRLSEVQDHDFDGYTSDQGDCDNNNWGVYPGAPEVCDGQDNDCDKQVDEGAVGSFWYADADADGFGSLADALQTCDPPEGYVADATDCDDTDGAIHPGVTEVCDGADQDCNGSIDDNAADALTWYADTDADTYGDAATTTAACAQPEGYVADATDCNDTRSDIHPDAPETDCWDQTDYNCDGSIAYMDVDGDGYVACEDCNDADYAIHPGATEVCDPEDDDEDCDGTAENTTINESVFARDADGDGYGDPTDKVADCDAPEGYVVDATDCDDTRSDIHPGAEESDCTDPTDYNCDGSVAYADADADSFAACEDCNDADAAISPLATEVCDGVDNDCDGSADGGATDALTWYADADADGYGDPIATAAACEQPAGYVADNTDCDDTDSSVTIATTWYADDDNDNFGDMSVTATACDAPAGYVADATDCDDTDASVAPDAYELCDLANIDEDCDGLTDDDDPSALGQDTFYADSDGDGYGDAGAVTTACSQPEGYIEDDSDCDDTNAAISPDAEEVCDEVDNNCNGVIDGSDATDATVWYDDADGDSFGGDNDYRACIAPSGHVDNSDDCDDTRSSVFPGASETCNLLDDDCDGAVDDGVLLVWYYDADGDSYGDSSLTIDGCTAPVGYVADATDCDDTDDTTSPGASEVCGDGVDNDCDIATDTCRPEGELSPDGVITGEVDERTGKNTISVGDVTGDGVGDVLVSSDALNEVYLFAGPIVGNLTHSDAAVTIEGDSGRSGLGSVIATAPDLDGDGVEEWLVTDFTSPTNGNVYLINEAVSESTVSVTDASWMTLYGSVSGVSLGSDSIHASTDADGDGGIDVLINTNIYNSYRGAVYVWSGLDATDTTATADLFVTGEAFLDALGNSLLSLDTDGDGQAEHLISSVSNDGGGTNAGAVYVVSADQRDMLAAADADLKLVGEVGDAAGHQLVDAGDLSGDGYPELLVSATGSDLGAPGGGVIYLLPTPLSAGSIPSQASCTVMGATEDDLVAAMDIGDVDQDGVTDLLVGAYGHADASGAIYLFYGPFAGSYTLSDAHAWADGAAETLTGSTVELTDLNGDDRLDLLASGYPHAGIAGEVYVYYNLSN